MKITFERTGGFGNIRLSATIEEEALSPDDARELRRLLADAGVDSLPSRLVPERPGPDRFQYELTVEEGGRSHRVTVSEEAMPNTLRPLIRWLTEAARGARD
ncbi:MAG: hypothetical protein HY900_24660 [Deltaproteobacteria bacterium]|nr:hypothetical protein [Deltaproteobacteria bacterium]